MNLEFQIYDFIEDHDLVDDDSNDKFKPQGNYIIHVFGRTVNNKSVYAKVTGYTPYFYIELPSKWENLSKTEIKNKLILLENWLKSRYNNKIWSQYKETLLRIDYIKSKKPEGFTYNLETKEEKKFGFARLVFNNSDGMKKYSMFFEKNLVPPIYGVIVKPTQFKLYEANLLPMLRCFHIRKISGCSWISIDSNKFDEIDNNEKKSYCDIEINVNWEHLNPIKKDFNAPFKIASFDIEVFSHDGQFPQAHRKLDQIIQIGITYTTVGQSLPYRKWIACLKNTNNVEDVNVVSFENEDELIDAFVSEIKDHDCDIMTGYNIFGFDEKYIYDRCDKILNMKAEMAYISKLKDKYCNFKEMKLSSSALGENILKFWETPGRVHIDLLKEVQKTYNLPSYKLDFVSSHFIRGEIESYQSLGNNKFLFKSKSIDDIQIDDYIHIEVIKGFVSDDIGDKYLVTSIDKDNKTLFVNGDSILDTELEISKHGGTIFWSQAKDDVGPQEIFKFQNEGPDKRAIVAKYCIKDCSLVNLLMNKLEIVTKNIEMANVCFVPLNYLFIRGQGIKLFSLCLKEFRDQGYIFPVIKVKKDEDGNTLKEDSYEGAIVFDPEPQIDYEANTTKDYASLYPSSIMHKNMSHETEVTDTDYDNIEGIIYYNAYFRESDGSTKYVRFAKIEEKLGVIPLILDKLLKERKAVKKLQKAEKDPFKWKILEAKQLAVKVTANSLYGQLGASTSPIACRNIAACTTSTGREMLLFAKKYDEEMLPWIFNGLKEAYKNNNIDIANFIINKELKNKDPEFIEKLKKYCSETISKYTFQPVVRYGDSVTNYTPIYIQVNNIVEILTIEELGEKYGNNNWLPCIDEGKQDKEFCELNNVLSWSDSGWTKIHRIIRHQLASNKKILRISTLHSIVDVTDDHSLLSEDKTIISPKSIKENINILCSNKLKKLSINNNFNEICSINVTTMIKASYYINYLNSINYLNYYVSYDANNNIIVNIGTSNENTNLVKSIKEIDYSGYVYDLTTDNHHFAAGVGNLIVHNTDSVFACFRFKEQNDELSSSESLELFKKIVEFGEELIKPFFLPKEQILFSELYKKYYSNVNSFELPQYPKCVPSYNNIILPVEERMKQFLKEYLYENYLSWLWTLQEIINKSYGNINNKLFDWAEYLLSKYRFTYNDLCDNRKDEIIIPLNQKIESFYKISTNKFNWHKSNNDEINSIVQLIEETLKNELTKTTNELHKLVKTFLDITLLEEWICSEIHHNVALTKEKKKLKRERKYNDKHLPELLSTFVETKLKCDFNKHKNNHYNKVNNFIKNILKEYIIQPYWDLIDNKIVYKIKIFNKSAPIIDKRTLDFSIKLGELSGELVKSHLPFPHDLEYEKTFWPFLILTKKRYVGNKYEFDSNKYKQDFMGIVLKRRDNAPIVKEICSGIIDNLINKRDPEGAKNFTKNALLNMFESKYDIKYFLQSRTLKLKESYADWTKIAHVFLADKIATREGSKQESGNRIEFAAICVPEKQNGTKLLQGEIIETPAYIKEHNIPINYMFYMKNQIMNPALQFLSLVDKDASEKIFKDFEEKYGIIKPKKIAKSKKLIDQKITEDDLSLENIIKNNNKLIIDTDDTISDKKTKKKKSVAEKIIGEPVIKTILKKQSISNEIDQDYKDIEITEKKKKKKSVDKEVIEIEQDNENSVNEEVIEITEKKKKKKSVNKEVIEIEQDNKVNNENSVNKEVIEITKKKKKSVDKEVIEIKQDNKVNNENLVNEEVIEITEKKKKKKSVDKEVIEIKQNNENVVDEEVIEITEKKKKKLLK
jgi:DNA polymerase elongation subunit (family B)